ncbi:MAG: VIT domain-containing protein [Polyangiales bacterium]
MTDEPSAPPAESPLPSTPPPASIAPPATPPSPRSRPGYRPWLLIVTVGALLFAVAITSWWQHRAKPVVTSARAIGARLDLAAGEVIVVEHDKESNAISGTPLAVSSRVKTGAGARALIRTGDGASVFLRGDTEVVLEAKGLSLERGEVWLDAPAAEGESIACTVGKRTVSASSAGLSITRAGDDVEVYVARGLAILTSPGGRVEINAGEQGAAKGSDAPKIAPVAFWQDWTGGMGDSRAAQGIVGSGSGRIYGIDPNAPNGAPARTLTIARQTVHATIRDGLSETEVDQTFGNPGGTSIEGWYWFTVPAEAIVTSFALETNGTLVEGEVVEKREAAAVYGAAIASHNDPALLEWIDGRSYRARIYPIPANGTRRVVLRYLEVLPTIEGKLRYVYPMRSTDPVRYDELAMTVDVGKAWPGRAVATSLDATVEEGAGGDQLVSMRRSGYVPRADFQVEISAPKTKALRAWRFAGGADQADYVMVRYVPEIAFEALAAAKGEVVVVVDTSAGGDESSKALRNAAAEGILRTLADGDRFALVALDVTAKVVYPDKGLAAATQLEISAALEKLAEHSVGGATDLGAMFEPALERLHGSEQPAIVYVGDGVTTSGETTSEALMERLRRSLSGSRARLFTVGTGPDARHELLTQLARVGGGRHFRVDDQEQTTEQALRLTAAIKLPTITDLEIDLGAGLDQPFSSATGKLARGEELVMFARTHHKLPEDVHVRGRAGGKDFDQLHKLEVEEHAVAPLVPRLWANAYARRLLGSSNLDDVRSKVLDLGVNYGLVTPFTSIIALEDENAFARFGVQRRDGRLRGVKLSTLPSVETGTDKGATSSVMLGAGAAGCATRDAPTSESDRPHGASGPMGKSAQTVDEEKPRAPMTSPTAAASASAYANESTPTSDIADPQTGAKTSPARGRPAMAPEPAAGDDSLRRDFKEDDGVSMHALGGGGGGKKDTASSTAAGASVVRTTTKPSVTDTAVDRAVAIPRPRPTAPKLILHCSDIASRPLFERILLWQRRLQSATTALDLIARYEAARAACELPDFRAQAELLQLIQLKITTEESAALVLSHFSGEPEAQQFLARALLRRTVDVRIAAAVSRAIYRAVDWQKVDRDVTEKEKLDDQIQIVRAAMLVAPGDPAGDLRLIRLLSKKGERQEALGYGRRLRDRGLMTPLLAVQLGDVLAESGAQEEALRTYSEIVEFDGDNPASRRALGDVYLRQGWYPAAYRQYKTLTDLESKSPTAWLRLAAAAAGAGRVDEALRIEREVTSGEGTPGPSDPRQWARLWSATRLGLLLSDPSAAGGEPAKVAIGRKLKELSLFSGPGTLALLTWDDLDARMELAGATAKGQPETLLGEATDAGATGLYAIVASTEGWSKGSWVARWKADAPMGRAAKLRLVVIGWDGKAFTVSVKKVELASTAREVSL